MKCEFHGSKIVPVESVVNEIVLSSSSWNG
ncbi:hypothetical protein TNIN_389011, partial [Trichonephila inaurata madagascariensis]